MEITLYKTTSDYITVNKVLTGDTVKECTVTTPCNLLSPQFQLLYFADIVNYNYVYAFNRYYYINDISMISGTHCIISCSVDVLKTYASDIKNCNATVVRSESVGQPTYIVDSKLPIHPNEKVVREIRSNNPFPIGINNYVLTTLKGGDSSNG